MAASVTYTFIPGQYAAAAQVNQNFADIVSYLNGLDIPGVPVAIVDGGTGATNATAALANLGGASLSYVNTQLGATGPVLLKADNLASVADPVASLSNLGGAPLTFFTTSRVVNFQGEQPIGPLIIKWGSGTCPNTGTGRSTLAVSYPTPFPSNTFVVLVSPRGNANSGAGGFQPSGGAITVNAAGFTAVLDTLGTVNFNQTCDFNYIAIGN
jgi:hypothetical protein